MKNIVLNLLALFMSCQLLMAQQVAVTGTVTDGKDGSGMPGVSVAVKGSNNGNITDMNGIFTLNVPSSNVVLVFSSVGYKTQEVRLKSGQKTVNVTLTENNQVLDEVVVIGYGVQKKKLVTGATVQVKGDDLQRLSTTNAFTAMQSQTPGVNIVQSSGQPGENFTVNIRGLGTTGDSAPLYVIDGVTGGNINNLNPSDIESIDVLKDAASAAIYGAHAANGVILVTTKQGKSGKIQVTYDGYEGIQNVWKMPSLLNAQEYMNIMDEVNFNEGIAAYDWKTILGSYYDSAKKGTWTGTNWLDAIRNKNALTQNHALNITGGSDISKFSLGVSYTSQEGILGKPVASKYERTSVRLNSDHVILKGDGYDKITFGENLNYNYTIKGGIGIGNQYWNDVSNVLRASPLMPIYDSQGNYFDYDDKAAMGLDQFDSSIANPVADMVYERGKNTSKTHNLNMSGNIQIQPIRNLVFKSQFGYKLSASDYRSYRPSYKLSATVQNPTSSVTQNSSMGWSFTWENTLNYKFNVNQHHFDLLAGQSLEKSGMGEGLSATNCNLLFDDYKHAYLANSQGIKAGQTTVGGSPFGEGRLVSFFGRVNYDWNETYMATLVLRSDGSSNFARGHRWGYFPSASLGWVLTNEDFMKSTKSWLDFLKIRGSWGQNGNCNIDNFQYLATVSFDATAAYSFGNDKDSQTTGGFTSIIPNTKVKWETSEQLDLGFDARFLGSRLGLTFDYYNKKTKDWLVRAPQLASYGTGAPYINGGDVGNKGVEVALGWNDRIGKDFTYSVNANVAFNKNKVTRIDNAEGIIHGVTNVLSQGTTECYRAQVGYPIGYFYGYKTGGIFQNQAEIDAWKAAGKPILQSNPQPGDVIFVDTNNDGKIDSNDKVKIGDPHPHYNMGLTITLGYKGFDFTFAGHGAFGQQIAKSYRKFVDGRHENYTTDVYNRWHGEGTSNKWPRLTAGSNANYQNISDLYIENGDYFKAQNITLGFDFKKLFPRMCFAQARLFVTAENLFTITKYSGMDPEIGYNGGTDSWASGLDIGSYPSPRTYLMGVNLKF